MPNQRKKVIGICDCGAIAKYGINRESLLSDMVDGRLVHPWLKLCLVCVRIIELENREVQLLNSLESLPGKAFRYNREALCQSKQ